MYTNVLTVAFVLAPIVSYKMKTLQKFLKYTVTYPFLKWDQVNSVRSQLCGDVIEMPAYFYACGTQFFKGVLIERKAVFPLRIFVLSQFGYLREILVQCKYQ